MKRYAILLLSLAVLGAAGMVCAHRVVGASAEAVEMYETVLAGDRAAAEGVEVDFPTESTIHLFWDTSLRVGAENVTETDFRFSPDGEIEQWGPEPELSLGVPGQMFGRRIDPAEQMYPIVADVVPRAPADGASSEKVRLRDYFEYMPLHLGWSCSYYTNEYGEERTYADSKQMDSEVERQIRRLFAIPVPEDYYVSVNVEKDADGDLLGWEVDFQERSLTLDYVSASAPKGEWILTQLRGWPGRYSCEGCDKLWYVPAGDAAAEPVCALELEEDELARDLEIDALGRPLLLVTRDGERYIRVVDGLSGGCVQTLTLPELGEGDGISRIYTGDSFVLVKSVKGVFGLYELTESGEYVPRMSGELCAPRVNLKYSDERMVMQWDGRRLVMAAVVFNLKNPGMRQAQGFMLWVYDAEGRDFSALYRNSLSMAEPWGDFGIMSYEARELGLR